MQRSAAARVRQMARRAARTGTRVGGVTSPRTTTAAKARRMSPRQARTFPGALSRDTSLHVCAAAARLPGSARAERPAPSAPSLRPLRRSSTGAARAQWPDGAGEPRAWLLAAPGCPPRPSFSACRRRGRWFPAEDGPLVRERSTQFAIMFAARTRARANAQLLATSCADVMGNLWLGTFQPAGFQLPLPTAQACSQPSSLSTQLALSL